mgnify:CR=1 FL=1
MGGQWFVMVAIIERKYFTQNSSFFVFNTLLSYDVKYSTYLYGHYHLVKSIVILCKKSYPCLTSMLAWKGEIVLLISTLVSFGVQRGRRCSWGSISTNFGICWRATIVIHFTQLWVYLVITTNFNIDVVRSFISTNQRAIMGWLAFTRLDTVLQVMNANLLFHCSFECLW